MRWFFCCLCLCSFLHAKRVEIYEDWNPNATGETLFERPAALEAPWLPHYYAIRVAFEKEGYTPSSSIVPIRIKLKAPQNPRSQGYRKLPCIKSIQGQFTIVDYRGFELIPMSTIELEGVYTVRSWDRQAHIPQMMAFRQIRGWTDFLHWLGLCLPKNDSADAKCVFFSGIGLELRDWNLKRLSDQKMIAFVWEPPTVQPEAYDVERQKCFKRIYTFDDDLVDNKRYFKFYLPFLHPRISQIVPFENRKFITLIAARLKSKYPRELYSEREKIIRFFEAQEEGCFDLYGRGWEKFKFKNWKGKIPGSFSEKLEVLKNYKFAIAYENSQINGYITEKLWHCFATGVVPVYWGANNINDYVPADCFIDRRKFHSDEELFMFLKAMAQSEWEGYVEKGAQFLQSDMAKRFTEVNFAETMVQAVRE